MKKVLVKGTTLTAKMKSKAKSKVKAIKKVTKSVVNNTVKKSNILSKDNAPTYNIGKLPTTFKEKFLEALRSGEYKQGRGKLLTGNKYCCLGVAGHLCEIGKEHLERGCYLNYSISGGISSDIARLYELSRKRVPKTLSQNLDLQRQLASFNDDGYSFKQIAQWIEKYL